MSFILRAGRQTVILATALAGCVSEPESSGHRTTARPSPYLGDDPTPPRASLDRGAITAAVNQAFEVAREIDIPAIVARYEALMAKADDACPTVSADESDARKAVFWYGDCTTVAGVKFKGYGSLTHHTGDVPEDGVIRDGVDGYMDAVIVDADGTSLDIGFYYLADWVDRKDGKTTYTRLLNGTAHASGSGAPDNAWLSVKRRGDLTVSYTAHDDGAREAYLDGALAGLDGQVHAVAFSRLYASFSATGPGCADPTGAVSFRQDGGGWYDVVFGAIDPRKHEVDKSKCDGCGSSYFGGQPTGEVCVDVTALGAFHGAPW
jgi:hypothetical protein